MLLSAPTLTAIDNVTVNHSSPQIVGLDGADTDGDNLTYSVSVAGTGSANLTAEIMGANDGVTENYNNNLVIETNLGTMVFELFDNLVPDVTARIEEMVNAGHYDGLTFHRVIQDFVIQTGSDTYESGTGYTQRTDSYTNNSFDDQFSVDLQHNSSGLLSVAKRTPDDSGSTDFFITDYNPSQTANSAVSNLRNLDYNYSIFGKIIEGMNVFTAITNLDDTTDSVDTPTSVVTINNAYIDKSSDFATQNATLMLKVGDGYTAGEQVTVQVIADDGTGQTATQEFTVTMQSDGDEATKEVTIDYDTSPVSTSSSSSPGSADPFLNSINDVVVPYGTDSFTISGTSIDVDGMSSFHLEETLEGTLFTTNGDEVAAITFFDNDLITHPVQSDYQDDPLTPDVNEAETLYQAALTKYLSAWSSVLTIGNYNNDPTLMDLPDGLEYASYNQGSGSKLTSRSYSASTHTLTFSINIDRTDTSLIGVYYIMIGANNVIESQQLSYPNGDPAQYLTTGYDTQVVTIVLQPPTPTSLTINDLNSSQTDDNTPLVTVTGLTTGLKVRILDENDNVVGEATASSTAATFDLATSLADGQHTLRAVQVATNSSTGEEAVGEAATSSAFTVDTQAPQAFTDVALTAASSGTIYTYDVGHPQEDGSSISFLLSGAPAGMTINASSALITWDTPGDSDYPSVNFDIIAQDIAGNQTVEHVTLTVHAWTDISGVVYLDANNNSIPDTGEGQAGVIVYADLNGNNQDDEADIYATTTADGSYSLSQVPAGSVILHQILNDGHSQLSYTHNSTTYTDTPLSQVQVITDGDATTLNNAATTIDGLTWAGALAMSPDGRYVYATSGRDSTSGDDAIAVFSRDANDGTLTYIQLIDKVDDSIPGLDDPNNLTVTPDGRHVYVTSNNTTNADTVVIFSRDADTGMLTHVATLTNGGTDAAGNTLGNLNGISNVAVSHDDEFVYVSAGTSSAINVFSRNRFSGLLTLEQTIIDGTNLPGVATMTLSSDGEFLYAGSAKGMVVYARDVVTGELAQVEPVAGTYLTGVRQIAITPDSAYLYAASNTDSALNIYTRNTDPGSANYGKLTAHSTMAVLTGLEGASSVMVNADGTKLYLAAASADALYVYDIEADGSLTLSQTLTHNGTDDLSQDITDLNGAVALVLDPAGNDVYVASRVSNSLGVYSNRTRSWSGAAMLLDVSPTGDNTGRNFLNDYAAFTVDSVDYNALQFNSDWPTGKTADAPVNWAAQRSTVRDITVTFSAQITHFDKAQIQLQRIFDVDGTSLTEDVTLNPDDVYVDGNQLLIRNLDLVDGVYQLTIAQEFDAALDGPYSTYFHQLLGDFNGDRTVNPADLSTLLYWRQISTDTNDYVDVPGYLDIRDGSDVAATDGRVDSHDMAVFAGSFGQFIPQDAVPIPDAVLSSISAPSTAADTAALAYYASQTTSLTVVGTDKDQKTPASLLDQLDNPNLVLQMIEQ